MSDSGCWRQLTATRSDHETLADLRNHNDKRTRKEGPKISLSKSEDRRFKPKTRAALLRLRIKPTDEVFHLLLVELLPSTRNDIERPRSAPIKNCAERREKRRRLSSDLFVGEHSRTRFGPDGVMVSNLLKLVEVRVIVVPVIATVSIDDDVSIRNLRSHPFGPQVRPLEGLGMSHDFRDGEVPKDHLRMATTAGENEKDDVALFRSGADVVSAYAPGRR